MHKIMDRTAEERNAGAEEALALVDQRCTRQAAALEEAETVQPYPQHALPYPCECGASLVSRDEFAAHRGRGHDAPTA